MNLDIGPYGNKSSISVAVVQSVMTGFPIDPRERHHKMAPYRSWKKQLEQDSFWKEKLPQLSVSNYVGIVQSPL